MSQDSPSSSRSSSPKAKVDLGQLLQRVSSLHIRPDEVQFLVGPERDAAERKQRRKAEMAEATQESRELLRERRRVRMWRTLGQRSAAAEQTAHRFAVDETLHESPRRMMARIDQDAVVDQVHAELVARRRDGLSLLAARHGDRAKQFNHGKPLVRRDAYDDDELLAVRVKDPRNDPETGAPPIGAWVRGSELRPTVSSERMSTFGRGLTREDHVATGTFSSELPAGLSPRARSQLQALRNVPVHRLPPREGKRVTTSGAATFGSTQQRFPPLTGRMRHVV